MLEIITKALFISVTAWEIVVRVLAKKKHKLATFKKLYINH